MIKIGLTGNIASGKTLSENIFKSYGIKVISADDIVHDLIRNDKKTIKNIINLFSQYDIFENNNIDIISRKKIAKIVFNNKLLREKLEQILHPQVIEKINIFFEENENEKMAIASIPLLFEANLQKMFDIIIFIQANENIRLKRLMMRNNYSESFARKIMDTQINENIKIPLSNFIVENNSDKYSLQEQIDKIIKKINT